MLKRGFQFAPGYRLQEFLGRGQFGQVWRATAPGGTAAAIKFIDLTDGQGQKEYDGVKRVKQINHANLMPITAIWLLDGQGQVIEEAPDEAIQTIDLSVQEGKGQSAMFIPKEVEPSWLAVSMLLGGMSLQKRLRECVEDGLPGIPPKELIRYMDESAKGLDFLNTAQHDLGEGLVAIQHCDVKPANIVLIGDSAVVCDFGLARILSRNQVTATSAAGTPAYMAPEAIAGKPSKTSDQYSLAVTYYHLRTGTLPVSDGSLWEVLDAHRRGKLSLGLVAEEEQEVLRKATGLEWEQRFESNIDFVDALREALRSQGHTRPSFVSELGSSQPKAGFTAPTVGPEPAVDDPTATYVTQMVPPPQALERTAPVIQGEEETNADLATDTAESTPVAAPEKQHESLADLVKGKPKAVYAGVGGVLLIILAYLFFPASDTPATPGKGGGNGDPPPIVKRTPVELFQDAVATFDQDEPSAVSLAAEAVSADASLADMQPLKLSGHDADIISTLLTPDSQRLVTVAYDDTPLLWNLDQGTPQSDLKPVRLVGHEAASTIEAAMIEPAGQRFVTGGFDGHAFVWNLQPDDVPETRIELPGIDSDVVDVTWHPTKPIVVTAGDSKIRVWKLGQATSAQPNGTVETKAIETNLMLKSVAIDPAGDWLVAVTDSIDLNEPVRVVAFRWTEMEDFSVERTPVPITVAAEGSIAEHVAFARGEQDQPLLVVGDRGGSLSMWRFTDDPDKKLFDREPNAHTQAVTALRVVHDAAADRDVIVSGGSGGTVRVRSLGMTSHTKTQAFGSAPVSAVDVSADARWVVVGTKATPNDAGTTWLWDASAESFRAIRLNSGEASVTTVRLSDDGKWIIVGRKDGTVQLWDQRKAKLLALSQPVSPPSTTPTPIREIETPALTLL